MSHDCFISYQHEDITLVQSLAAELERRGLSCWFAPRNCSGAYSEAIVNNGIRGANIFLLMLNSRSAVSDAVLDEVETAHNFSRSDNIIIQPICIEPMDFNAPDFQGMMLYIRRFQFVFAQDVTNLQLLAEQIISSQPALQKTAQKRTQSQYIIQEVEDVRLAKQNHLLDLFDLDVFYSSINRYTNPSVLDIGCGTGSAFFSRIKVDQIGCYIGVDKSHTQICNASKHYSVPNCSFYEHDLEADDFSDWIDKQMRFKYVQKFDIIIMSMVLLHLKNPQNILTIAKSILAPSGTLIIRDIDDGLNFAYPDPDNSFDRIYWICDHDEQSGNRKNGRQIFSYLVNAGFKKIKLERQGLSTEIMDNEQKETMFQLYFPFTLANAKTMYLKNPWNKEYKEDYLWYQSVYEEIHKNFLRKDFIFSLGFVSYTAS